MIFWIMTHPDEARNFVEEIKKVPFVFVKEGGTVELTSDTNETQKAAIFKIISTEQVFNALVENNNLTVKYQKDFSEYPIAFKKEPV